MSYVLTIDQGTTGSRVFIIDKKGETIASVYEEFTQHFPRPGWVEHDANEIWSSVSKLIKRSLEKANVKSSEIVSIGITNQRETTVVWNRSTGEPVYNAIVWQCRRTSEFCNELKSRDYVQLFQEKTGLVIDAYFSGTKIKWILDNVKGAREKADHGLLAFGTIDSFLLFKLTQGKEHKTDYTNASRTLIYNIHEKKWDDELLELIDVPRSLLPEVQPSASNFGSTSSVEGLQDGTPIYSMIGDQQSALYGQLCHSPGEVKNTYGTGCFMLMNLGEKNLISNNGLLTTLACDRKGEPVYALEGSVFIGGAVIQYLRDSLKFFSSASDSESLARSVETDDGVVFVPAFAGLGAPYWDQDARGAIYGLTRDTTAAQITRAALKSIALQSYDLSKAMEADSGLNLSSLRVDGGATMNSYLMEYQSAILGVPVEIASNTETTVMGATYLAGLAAKLWNDASELRDLNPIGATFHPNSLKADARAGEIERWHLAVKRTLSSN